MEIPPLNREIEQVYAGVLAKGARAVAVTSAGPGEGVTSVASALAQRSLLAGQSTLLVDLNLNNPSFSGQLELESVSLEFEPGLLEAPQLVCAAGQGITLTGVTAPGRREAIVKLRKPGVLEQCIASWQQMFDTVIFDTSPVNVSGADHIPPERVAAACDGSLLVVLSGRSTEAMVATALNRLNAGGAQLLGCLYNDRDNPPLQSELLREVTRLAPFFGRVANRLSRWIKNNHLLSLEV